MTFNKEIISRIILGLIFFGFAARILLPLFLDRLKGKQLGLSKNTEDLDRMIKRQKELFKSKYDIYSPDNKNVPNQRSLPSNEVSKIKNEIMWGGSELQKSIQKKITSLFSYQFSDSKLNSFLNLIDKRNYLVLLDSNAKKIEHESVVNFLSSIFIFLVLIDEIREKEFNFITKCAQKLKITDVELALSIQIKLLLNQQSQNIKEDRLYADEYILHQFSDETIKSSFENIIRNEASLWQKSISTVFEELTLFANYASILSPMEKLKNKKDYLSALKNLNSTSEDSFEDIKKHYKKMALLYHPDKISPQKLPKTLEKKALQKFNIIQESFEILSARNQV